MEDQKERPPLCGADVTPIHFLGHNKVSLDQQPSLTMIIFVNSNKNRNNKKERGNLASACVMLLLQLLL